MTQEKAQEKKSRLFFMLFLLFVFTIPVSEFISTRLLILVLLTSFFLKAHRPNFLQQTWDVLLYLAVLGVGLIYTDELQTGWGVLETSLSLLAMPIVMIRVGQFDKNRLHEVFYAFSAGLLLTSVICLSNAGYGYYQSGQADVFFYDRLTEIIDSHPTYLAYYYIACISFGLYHISYENGRLGRGKIAVASLFFFLMLMLTGGLTAFVSILLILSFFVLKFIMEPKTRHGTWTFVMVCFMIVTMFMSSALITHESSSKNDTWERFVLWESALNATPDLVFGVGTGDYNTVLNQYYRSQNLAHFADENYNAHNQFIHIMFSNGLIGLAAFLLLITRPLYFSIQRQNVLGILIFFPFLIYGITEVYMGRYQGVVFYALLHQVFLAHYHNILSGFR